MSKPRRGVLVCLIALLAVAAIPASVAAATCSAQPFWFSTPTLPDDVSSATDCAFQQFSWQSFAALVLDQVNDNPLFESYMQSQGVFVGSGSTPVSYGSQPSVPSSCTGSGATLQLTQIDNTDADSAVLEAQDVQPLVDQNGNWVHYGIQMNETAYDYLVNCSLWQGGCFNSAGSNIVFPGSTTLGNSIVVKTAWKVLTASDTAANYLTATAAVSPTSPTNSGCTTVTVGLVGMHIATKTPTQAEWVWSTFEHVNNDPPCSALTTSPPLGGSWSFYNASYNGNYYALNTYFNPCSGDSTTCGSDDGANDFCSACTKSGISTQVCAVNPTGGDDEGNIEALNTSAWSTAPSYSIVQKYKLVGTEWTIGGTTTGTITGSTLLANSVAETYVQTTDSCFSCHRSTFKSYPPASEFATASADFSHLFDAISSTTASSCNPITPPSGYSCPSVTTTASTNKHLLKIPQQAAPRKK